MSSEERHQSGVNLLHSVRSREMSFQNWCSGESNQLATWAARIVTDYPGTRFNPLVIVGPTGVGKSHLAFAVGNEVARRFSDCSVKATSGNEFYNEVVKAYQTQTFDCLTNSYRALDFLIVDDVHHVEKKTRTQAELLDAVDFLLSQGKQVVLTANRTPGNLPGFETHLVARVRQGLILEISKPSHAELLQHFVALCERNSLKPGENDLQALPDERGLDHFDVHGVFNSFRAHVEWSQTLGAL